MVTKTTLLHSSPRLSKERLSTRDNGPSVPRDLRQPPRGSSPDELCIQTDAVSLCLLVNRRHGHLRVIDFRAGPTVAKRNTVLAAARREGIEKVLTLVERDEVATWMRLGFDREGSIPGFYRRSDAWIMGIVVATALPLTPAGLPAAEEDDDLPAEVPVSAAAALAERTLLRAKKLLRDDGAPLPSVKLAPLCEADAQRAVLAAQKKGVALTGFEPFGRDTTRDTYTCTSRGGTVVLSAEHQPFFQNTFLEILVGPKNEAERVATTAALGVLTEKLRADGKVNAFTIVPGDDAPLAATLMASGFQRSGALASHLRIGGERKDAVVWAKRLLQAD